MHIVVPFGNILDTLYLLDTFFLNYKGKICSLQKIPKTEGRLQIIKSPIIPQNMGKEDEVMSETYFEICKILNLYMVQVFTIIIHSIHFTEFIITCPPFTNEIFPTSFPRISCLVAHIFILKLLLYLLWCFYSIDAADHSFANTLSWFFISYFS